MEVKYVHKFTLRNCLHFYKLTFPSTLFSRTPCICELKDYMELQGFDKTVMIYYVNLEMYFIFLLLYCSINCTQSIMFDIGALKQYIILKYYSKHNVA